MAPTGSTSRVPPQRGTGRGRLDVTTNNGPVSGLVAGDVRCWRGIPYGTAERFGPARHPPGWVQPRPAEHYGPVAPQLDPRGRRIGAEACLSLNVWSPTGGPSSLPVLVWIHGGGMVRGSGAEHDGSALAALGPAVVVTVNYRLGPLGFEGPDGATSPALTDLLLALEWVSRNVAGFGGDPARVTVAGHEAGATLACALVATPAARGLVRRAVAFGGPGGAIRSGRAGSPFRLVLDGRPLRSPPVDAVRAGAARDVELWLGWCRREMAGPVLTGPLQDRPAALPALDSGVEGHGRDWVELLHLYQQTGGAGENPLEALLTDALCRIPAVHLAEAQASAGGRVWMSRFDHAPSVPPFGELGAGQGADATCLWAQTPRFPAGPGRAVAEMSAADISAARALQQAVLRFADSGSPAGPGLEGWLPYAPPSRCTALFDQRVSVVQDPAGRRRLAWEQLRRRTG